MISAAEVRARTRALRAALSQTEIDLLSAQITEKALSFPEVISAKTIFLYRSFQGEVDTESLRSALTAQGKTLAFPCVRGEEMVAVCPTENGFRRGAFGILEPVNGRRVEKIDVAFVPSLACDFQKNRIGFGKGYYDRFLTRTPCVKIALCYDFQVFSSLPTHEKDVPMDIVLTPTRIID